MNHALIDPIGQRNAAWARVPLGNSVDSTIGQYGCYLLSVSMLNTVHPLQANADMKAHGVFQPAGAKCPACVATYDLRGVGVPWAQPLVYVSGHYPDIPFPDNELSKLTKHLWQGRPAVLEVDSQLQTPGQQQHFVFAVGIFGRDAETQIIVNDPWYADQSTLCPRYGANLGRALVRALLYG